MNRFAAFAACLIVGAAAEGCRRPASPPASVSPALTPAQEAATKDYVALLDRQLQIMEQSAEILGAVQDNQAAKDTAKQKLVHLAVAGDALERRVRDQQPTDVLVIATANQRLAERKQQVADKLLAEVRRINQMPGGQDFFQSELRPLLAAVKGR
jgi:hypothetical protein